ncbi:hypothetical protein ACQRCW_02345 [Desulfovibrio sp. SGI.082]|uniref:hypothetical protein n=1 Tax=unclassified Desulfovibrio TaxID=2593640 RepID=UPI003D08F6EA
MENKLYFSTYLLEIDGSEFSKENLDLLWITMPYTSTIQEEKKCKKFYVERKNNFLLISITEGHFLPLSENVYDRLLNREVPNKRNENEAEWLSQTFAVYDFRTKIFYLSNSNKKVDIKALFEIILKDREKITVEILNIYKDVNDFIKEVNQIGKIKFTRIPDPQMNIFSDRKEFDPRWADGASSFSVELRYKNKYAAAERLKKLLSRQPGEEVQGLMCIGYGDEKVEKIFKVDSFIEKLTIDAQRNERGLYEDSLVFFQLMEKLR